MRPRWRLRTMMIAMPLLGLFFSAILPACDVMGRGPYTTWYNRRCARIAAEARLVGRPEADVERVLGPATFTYLDTTYNYCPVRWIPYSKFQVHCQDGFVTGVEMFDD